MEEVDRFEICFEGRIDRICRGMGWRERRKMRERRTSRFGA